VAGSGVVGYCACRLEDLMGHEDAEKSFIRGGKGADADSALCIGHAGDGIAPALGIGWGGDREAWRSAACCALCEGFESLQNQPMVDGGCRGGFQIYRREGVKLNK
jgi:hypothetical protein